MYSLRVKVSTAFNKAGYYLTEYSKSLSKLVVDPGDATYQTRKGLPFLVNMDGGSMYPALGSSTRPALSRIAIK